jgi:deoxyribose-phosphate aldolase
VDAAQLAVVVDDSAVVVVVAAVEHTGEHIVVVVGFPIVPAVTVDIVA